MPLNLIDQLSDNNGVLLSPVEEKGKQYLKSVTKINNTLAEEIHGIVKFVPLLDGTTS